MQGAFLAVKEQAISRSLDRGLTCSKPVIADLGWPHGMGLGCSAWAYGMGSARLGYSAGILSFYTWLSSRARMETVIDFHRGGVLIGGQ